MNINLINPFIKGVVNTLETMVGIKPNRLDPFLKDSAQATGDITGIISFADKDIVQTISREVMDLTGELANIIVGGAKQELAKLGLSFHISIPTIIVGKNHTIHHQMDTPVLVIPFTIDDHSFLVEVTLKISKSKL